MTIIADRVAEVRITVLGKSPAWQDAGGACSGYLVESGGTCLLLDCGPGVLGRLRRHRDYAEVDAIVLTHLHADHVLDLVPYASALRFSPRGGAGELRRPALHVPPGGREGLATLSTGGHMEADHIERPFALREYDPDETLVIGELQVRFQLVPHYVPAYAIEVAGGGVRVTYGADCAPNEALPAFARGTDLLLVEATLQGPDIAPRGHMTAAEAGALGRRAQARRLVVTHFSDELSPDTVRADAARAFGGEVDLAADGSVFEVKVHPSAADAVK
jgi:ribonuclease BN (tRNA processing enzyme)